MHGGSVYFCCSDAILAALHKTERQENVDLIMSKGKHALLSALDIREAGGCQGGARIQNPGFTVSHSPT